MASLRRMNRLIFAVLATQINDAASYYISIHPYKEVVVKENQDLEVECKLDERLTIDSRIFWNAFWEISAVSLTLFGSYDEPVCNSSITFNKLTRTVYMTSCNKITNSIKLKLYNVSSTNHDAKIGCGLRINGILYENTTTIYVFVPVKSITMNSKENSLMKGRYKQFLLECKTSPSRPVASIKWNILNPENRKQIGSIAGYETKTLFKESGLWSTTSYLNYFTGCIQSRQLIVCEVLDNSSDASPNATLNIISEKSFIKGDLLNKMDGGEFINFKLNRTCTNTPLSNNSWLQNGSKDFSIPVGIFTYIQTIEGKTTYTCLEINSNVNTIQELNITVATDTINQFLLNNWSLFTASFLLLVSIVTVLVACFVYRRLRQWRMLAKRQNIQMQLLQEIIGQYMEIDPRIYENNCRIAELNTELPYSNLLPQNENPYYRSVVNNQ